MLLFRHRYCFPATRYRSSFRVASHSDRKIARPVVCPHSACTAAEASLDRESAGPTRWSAARMVVWYLSCVHTARFFCVPEIRCRLLLTATVLIRTCFIGPIPWGYSGPLSPLSLSSSSLWTSMRRRRATVQWRHLVNWREAARCG